MFGKEWMEFFERESPIAYYCLLFLQLLISLIPYFACFVLLIIISSPLFMIYYGIKGIKVKLLKYKTKKKLEKEKTLYEQMSQDSYLEHLDKKIKKKKKSKHS